MKFNGALAVAITAMALAACSGHPNDAVTFTVPPGYVSKASVGPFIQMWDGPDGQKMMLNATPGETTDLKATFEHAANTKFESFASISICGHQAAVLGLGTMTALVSGRAVEKGEFVATMVGGKTYVAVYSHPVDAPADPAAERAIRNICPK